MRGLRIIAGNPKEGPRSTHDRSDVAIMQQLGVHHVATRIWKARLRYLQRMVQHGGAVLNAIIQATPILREQ
eukprot:3677861-Alexandrium_andersonii.AAC.1